MIGSVVAWALATARPVLLVEDDDAFVEAVRLVLTDEIRLIVARSRAEALACTEPYETACVDLGLPDGDGVDVIQELASRRPDLPIIVLTVHQASSRILSAFQAGASGYLLKEHLGERLVGALDEVQRGGSPMSPSIAQRVLKLLRSLPSPGLRPDPQQSLTERELAVLRAFADGMTYAAAADALGMSVNTLRTHVRHIYAKLLVETRTEAVLYALQLGLLERAAPSDGPS